MDGSTEVFYRHEGLGLDWLVFGRHPGVDRGLFRASCVIASAWVFPVAWVARGFYPDTPLLASRTYEPLGVSFLCEACKQFGACVLCDAHARDDSGDDMARSIHRKQHRCMAAKASTNPDKNPNTKAKHTICIPDHKTK